MKKILSFFIAATFVIAATAQGYNIKLQSNFKSGIVYLTYYMGKDFILQDSSAVSNTGTSIFKSDKKLPGGIYVIVFPGKRLTTDFLIDKEQVINIVADTNHLDKIIITGSPANVLFKDYQAFVAVKGKQLQDERTAYANAKTKEDSSRHELAYKKYSKELNDYRTGIVTNKPTSMMAALLNALKEPAYPSKIPVTHQDSVDNYNYYKQHYWDGISFMDERIVRTPFFCQSLKHITGR